jgi:hypothetical protein
MIHIFCKVDPLKYLPVVLMEVSSLFAIHRLSALKTKIKVDREGT